MPEFKFDVTEGAVAAAEAAMAPMPGNAGQESLISNAVIDGFARVTVDIRGPYVDVQAEYDVDIQTSHPDAVYLITEAGVEAFQEYAENAASIEGLIGLAFDSL